MGEMFASIVIMIFLVIRTGEAGVLNIAEGNECVHPSGVTGICSKISNCPGKSETLKQPGWGREPICSYQGTGRATIAIMCCTVGRPGQKSRETCNKIEELASQNFHRFDSISNGVPARKKFPHMALLGYENADTDPDVGPDWKCGGTLVSNRFVLTAAHCVITASKIGNVTTVRLGENDRSKNETVEKDFKIDQIFTHPDYKTSFWYNDIALIKLQGEVTFTDNIYPACLYTKPKEPNNLIVSGWGSADLTSNNPFGMSKLLMEGNNTLNPVDSKDCTRRYILQNGNAAVPNGITDEMFCATHKSLQISSDTCRGDSGGPIQLRNVKDINGNEVVMYEVVGITSGGPKNCGGEPPGIYTRIYHFLNWIENIITQDENVISNTK